MIISDNAVRNRTTVFVLTAAIILTGIICYINLPLESAPDVSIPNVFVTTTYTGVSPEDIESSITVKIEKELKGLEGVKKIQSTSAEGISMINIEFVSDVDIKDALIKVGDKVDIAKRELPPDLEDDPSVTEVNLSEMPILVISVTGNCGLRILTKAAEELEDLIEGINGVLDVEVIGGVTREIQIEIFPERMALYGIPFTTLQSVVSGENSNVSGGSIRTSEGRLQLRVPGEFTTVDEVESIVIGTRGNEPVYLRDVAKVVNGIKDRESYARTNGRDAVTLYVKKRIGMNIVQIVDEVNELTKKAALPSGTRLITVMDQAKEIRGMLADLENNILSGLILVVLVVCTTMGFRNAILVSLSIPLSMLITFVVLMLLGITLNMVVLFSLTLALGMLVDNAIVIIENIFRFMQQGVPRFEAAKKATGEVAWPIIGSSLTTIAAFFPLLFWDGIMGGFMVFLPKTVIITLASCLFVALVINPALAAVLMKVTSNGNSATADEVMSGGEHPMMTGGGRVLTLYRSLLRGALNYRFGVVSVAGTVLILTICFWLVRIGLDKPQEFFPAIDPKNAWVGIDPPEGAGITYSDQLVREAACRIFDSRAGSSDGNGGKRPNYRDCIHPRKLKKFSSGKPYDAYSHLPNIEFVYEKSAAAASGGFSFFGGGGNNQVGVQFVDIADRFDEQGRPVTNRSVIKQMEELIRDIPGGTIRVEQAEEGPPTGSPINIEISGDNFKVLGQLAEKVEGLVKQVPHVRNVHSDFKQGSPTLEIKVDRKRASILGLSTSAIGFVIKSAINGTIVSSFKEDDEDYDIVIRFPDDDRSRVDVLRQLMIPSRTAGLVPLTTIADIDYVGGLGSINRIDHRRVVTVKADVDKSKTTGAVARMQAEALMAGMATLRSEDIADWPHFCSEILKASNPVTTRLKSMLQGDTEHAPLEAVTAVSSSSGSSPSRSETGLRCFRYALYGFLLFGAAAAASLLLFRRQRQLLAAVILAASAIISVLIPASTLVPDDTDKSVEAILKSLNEGLGNASMMQGVDVPGLSEKMSKLRDGDLSLLTRTDAQLLNRRILEAALPDTISVSPPIISIPRGYSYSFTGENDFEKESSDFLKAAMGVALLLIVMVLVIQFNSILFPCVIMSAVVLSLGGVFLGLGIHNMPFGVIMTAVGTISLAGVVVNNAIVLVDYTRLLIKRGMNRDEAIVAAGATRLRPVVLTAVTTILGLIPMVTGISIDFQPLRSFGFPQMQWVSESSQYWGSMAVAIIYGLGLATLLTLLVVPVLFSLTDTLYRWGFGGVRWACCRAAAWWMGRFDRNHNTSLAAAYMLSLEQAVSEVGKKD